MLRRVLILLMLLCDALCSAQQIDSLLEAGIAHFEKGEYELSLFSFEQSATEAYKSNKLPALCIAWNNMGNAYARMNDELNGLVYYRKALTLAESLKDYRRIANTSFNIGSLYSDHKHFNKAIPWYNEAFKQAEKLKDSKLAANCLNNSAVIFEQLNQLSKAIKFYNQAVKIYISEKDTSNIAQTLSNIAIVNKKQGAFRQAIIYYKESLKLSNLVKDKYTEAATLNNLGNVYYELGNYLDAQKSIQLALEKASQIGAVEIIIETYDGLSLIHERTRNFEEALKYRKLFDQEKSNIYNLERQSQLLEFEGKFQSERKQKEILVLKQQQKISSLLINAQSLKIKYRNYLLSGLIILLLMTGFIIYSRNKRLKLKAEIERQKLIHESGEIERRRIAKDIHDDFGAGLSRINMLSELIVIKSNHEQNVAEHAKKIGESTRYLVENMTSLIWMLTSEKTTARDLLIRIREYSADYLENFPIIFQQDYPEILPLFIVSKEICHAVFMTVKEALNNIVKHANASNVSMQVSIDINFLRIVIIDNGIGFSLSQESSGNGLNNMKSRIETCNGIISIISLIGTGTEMVVQLPVDSTNSGS
jgi:signal transduction histidine kinase